MYGFKVNFQVSEEVTLGQLPCCIFTHTTSLCTLHPPNISLNIYIDQLSALILLLAIHTASTSRGIVGRIELRIKLLQIIILLIIIWAIIILCNDNIVRRIIIFPLSRRRDRLPFWEWLSWEFVGENYLLEYDYLIKNINMSNDNIVGRIIIFPLSRRRDRLPFWEWLSWRKNCEND